MLQALSLTPNSGSFPPSPTEIVDNREEQSPPSSPDKVIQQQPPPPFCRQCKLQCEGCQAQHMEIQVPCTDASCQGVVECTDQCTIVECDQEACYDQSCESVWYAQPHIEPWNGAWFCDACPKPACCDEGHTGPYCTDTNCFPTEQLFPPAQLDLDMPPSQQRRGGAPFFPNQQHYFQALASAYPGSMPPPPMNMMTPQAHQYMSNQMAAAMGSVPFSGTGSNTPSLASSMSVQSSPTPSAFNSHTLPLTCQWAHCHMAFATLEDLKTHIDSQHLHLPGVPCAHVAQPPGHTHSMHAPPTLDPSLLGFDLSGGTECPWGDCGTELRAEFEPNSIAGALALAEHLLQNHLNLEHMDSMQSSMDVDPLLNHPPPSNHVQTMVSPVNSAPHFQPQNSRASSSTTEEHVCEWENCNAVFDSASELMQHLTNFHVGSGKNEYWCRWRGCDRNSEGRAFASKQKILRHVQSHTGYRPYECEICHQFFSEPATLQQHKRRHTNERPFVCDYPGCGKAFAIAGALTIHKRTHNGEKPFKCTYCDRAFSESSNYTKHLRTHTGSKPYQCPEVGCGKRFSRPDQLNRHAQTHKSPPQGRGAPPAAGGDDEESDEEGM